MVLKLAGERISTLTLFDNSGLGRFCLPRTLRRLRRAAANADRLEVATGRCGKETVRYG